MKFNTQKPSLVAAALLMAVSTYTSTASADCKSFVQRVENEGKMAVDIALQVGGVTSLAALEIRSGVCEKVRQEFINRGKVTIKNRAQAGGVTAAVYARLGR